MPLPTIFKIENKNIARLALNLIIIDKNKICSYVQGEAGYDHSKLKWVFLLYQFYCNRV